MNKKFSGVILIVVGVVLLFAAAGLYAGTEVKDVIEMNNKAYAKHKKSIMKFSHKKHADEYAKEHPELYKNKCGECHHDKDNKPLAELKDGDEVQNCIECHKKPAEMSKQEKKEMKKAKLSNDEKKSKKLEYHAEALHYNCRGCHKLYNKKIKKMDPKPEKAPTTCKKCHPKKKK